MEMSFADVFIPQLGKVADELAHHVDAFLIVQIDYVDSFGSHESRRAGKVDAFADDDFGMLN